MATARCTSCQQGIIWTISPAGAKLCLDARTWADLVEAGDLVTMTGPTRYTIRDDAGERYAVKVEDPGTTPGSDMFISHWATCPTRAVHKKR